MYLPTVYPRFCPKCDSRPLPFTISDTSRNFQKILRRWSQTKWEINLENTPNMKMVWHTKSRFPVPLKLAVFSRFWDDWHRLSPAQSGFNVFASRGPILAPIPGGLLVRIPTTCFYALELDLKQNWYVEWHHKYAECSQLLTLKWRVCGYLLYYTFNFFFNVLKFSK